MASRLGSEGRTPRRQRRLLSGATLLFLAAASACAAVSGLDQFAAGSCSDCDAQAESAPPDETTPADEQGAVDQTPLPNAEPDAPEDLDAPADSDFDATLVADGVEAASSDARTDGSLDKQDARGTEDAPKDVATDAVQCNSTSCNGCCTASGLCAAGGLASACGAGGAQCSDCASSGLACSVGRCVEAPSDAGAGDSGGACVATMCANLCVPYFVQCCKADAGQTCGCALLFPPGSCN